MSRPFGHAAFERRSSDSVVLSLALADAPEMVGIGECAPRTYVTGESAESVIQRFAAADLSAYAPLFDARDAGEAFRRLAEMTREADAAPAAQSNLRCLLELAIFDLLCHRHRRTCLEGLRDCVQGLQLDGAWLARDETERLQVSVVIDSAVGLQAVPEHLAPHVVKVKADDDLEQNVARMAAVRKRFGDEVKLIVDANMSWRHDTAASHVEALSPFDIDLYEEPLASRQYAQLRQLRRQTGARVMLDESLVTFDDAVAAVESEACDAFNIRVSKCGGLLPSIRLIDFALARSIPYQLGVQVAEVGPLINASRALAFLYGRHFIVEAGQSDRFFDASIVSPRPTVDRVANSISPHAGHGFGMSLNENAAVYEVGRS